MCATACTSWCNLGSQLNRLAESLLEGAGKRGTNQFWKLHCGLHSVSPPTDNSPQRKPRWEKDCIRKSGPDSGNRLLLSLWKSLPPFYYVILYCCKIWFPLNVKVELIFFCFVQILCFRNAKQSFVKPRERRVSILEIFLFWNEAYSWK